MGRNFRHLDNLLSSQNSASKINFLFSFMYSQIQTYKFCTHSTNTHTHYQNKHKMLSMRMIFCWKIQKYMWVGETGRILISEA